MQEPHPRFDQAVEVWVSCAQPPIREPFTRSRVNERIKPLGGVVRDVPFIQPKRELIDVTEKMLGAGVMIDAVQSALQDGPNALNRVGGYRTARELTSGMVYRLVTKEKAVEIRICAILVGVDSAARFHRAVDLVL